MFDRLPLAALAATCLLALTSCLDYEEDLTIHKDLSGEALVTFTLPDALLPKYSGVQTAFSQDAITKRFDAMSGVKLQSYSKSTDRKPVVKLHITFSSLEKLNEAIAANPPASLIGGQFVITKVDGNVRIERKLGIGDTLNDLPESNYISYKTHYDGTIAKTDGLFNQHGSDVRHRYALTELLAQKPVLVTEITKSLPWMWILICIAVVGGAAYYGFQLTGKKKVLVNPAPRYPVPGAAQTPPAAQAPPPAAPPSTPPQAGGAPRPTRPGPPQPRRPGGPPQA